MGDLIGFEVCKNTVLLKHITLLYVRNCKSKSFFFNVDLEEVILRP